MDDTELSLALEALAHTERREVVGALVENETATVEASHGTEVALIHNHLPKLADYGFIEYEAAEELRVSRGPDWETVEAVYTNVQRA